MAKTNLLLIVPELAAVIGLNEAIVLHQIHYWIEKNRAQKINFIDGHTWVFQTYREWNEQFPFWSERTLERIFRSLENKGYIIASRYNKMKYDRTKWYTIPYDSLSSYICSFLSCNTTVWADVPTEKGNASRQDCNSHTDEMAEPIQENNKENNTDENGLSSTLSFDYSHIKSDKRDIIDEFIPLYYRYYEIYTGELHPNLKPEQLDRIRLVIGSFISKYYLGLYELKLMMKQFFKCGIESDHNLNHFATEKVLEHRFREAVYRASPLLKGEYDDLQTE